MSEEVKHYATLSQDGLPQAFYIDGVHDTIPPEAVEITEAQWRECIENQGLRRFQGDDLVQFTPPQPPPVWPRAQRDALLTASDWTQLADSTVTGEKLMQWRQYRQFLRDLPHQHPDPLNVTWPQKPA